MSEIPESKKPREFWIYKGESNFCHELVMDDDFAFVKCKPDGFYDIISEKDTIENGVHVIEFSAYEQLQKQNQELINTLKFYADKENYEDSDVKIEGIVTWYMKTRKILEDDGEIAREILAKFSKGDL